MQRKRFRSTGTAKNPASIPGSSKRDRCGTASPEALARDIVKRGLNVRQAEKLSRDVDRQRPVKRRAAERDADIVALENDLGRLLGLTVAISHQGERGELKIAYRSLEQLDEVIRRLRNAPF